MPYTPIVGTLGYVLSKDRNKVLMVHRTAREHDYHRGKFNGLGGKMERGEDVETALKREIYEEAGIKAVDVNLRGTINWTGFGPKLEDWLGFIFIITSYEGEVNSHSPEGPLEWIAIKDLNSLPMWEGDKFFLPLVFDDDPRVFHGFMPYENETPLNWTYTR